MLVLWQLGVNSAPPIDHFDEQDSTAITGSFHVFIKKEWRCVGIASRSVTPGGQFMVSKEMRTHDGAVSEIDCG